MASASESAHSPGGSTWKSTARERPRAVSRKGSGTARTSFLRADATVLPGAPLEGAKRGEQRRPLAEGQRGW